MCNPVVIRVHIVCAKSSMYVCVLHNRLHLSPPPTATEKFGEVKRKPSLRNGTQSGSHASSSFARMNLSWGNFTTLAPGCRIEGVRRTAEVKRGSSVSLGWLTTDQQPLSSLGLGVTFASHEFLMWPCVTWSFVTRSIHLGPLKRHDRWICSWRSFCWTWLANSQRATGAFPYTCAGFVWFPLTRHVGIFLLKTSLSWGWSSALSKNSC